MIEKITLNEALLNVEEGNGLVSVLGITEGNYVKKRKQQEFIPNENIIYGSVASRYKYAIAKYIGLTIDMKECVLLVAKKKPNAQDFSGIIGELMALRGGSGSSFITEYYHVGVAYAYISTMLESKEIIKNNGISVGRFQYNGEEYVGIKFRPASYLRVSFTGILSDNCVFQMVEASAVTQVEE